MLPDGFSFAHHDVLRRANLLANPASNAFFIGKKRFIHFGNIAEVFCGKSPKKSGSARMVLFPAVALYYC